jgi:RNA polymerase sigma factor (sigma-70 family)
MIQRIGLPEADDRFHDMVVIVMSAIRSDSLRDSARLMGFVQTIVRRQIGASIRASIIERKRTTAEQHVILQSGSDPEVAFSRDEEKQLAQGVLDSLSARHREIIVRFYVEEQSAAVICADMGLTATQFRLLKWRAKVQFTTRCRGKLGTK